MWDASITQKRQITEATIQSKVKQYTIRDLNADLFLFQIISANVSSVHFVDLVHTSAHEKTIFFVKM